MPNDNLPTDPSEDDVEGHGLRTYPRVTDASDEGDDVQGHVLPTTTTVQPSDEQRSRI